MGEEPLWNFLNYYREIIELYHRGGRRHFFVFRAKGHFSWHQAGNDALHALVSISLQSRDG
jgi:hypothetical protein